MGALGMDQPRFTRLSKVLAAVLLVLFAAAFFAPSSRAYLSLVPGRCVPGHGVEQLQAHCTPLQPLEPLALGDS